MCRVWERRQGDTGETVRVGSTYDTAQPVKLFFKVVT